MGRDKHTNIWKGYMVIHQQIETPGRDSPALSLYRSELLESQPHATEMGLKPQFKNNTCDTQLRDEFKVRTGQPAPALTTELHERDRHINLTLNNWHNQLLQSHWRAMVTSSIRDFPGKEEAVESQYKEQNRRSICEERFFRKYFETCGTPCGFPMVCANTGTRE